MGPCGLSALPGRVLPMGAIRSGGPRRASQGAIAATGRLRVCRDRGRWVASDLMVTSSFLRWVRLMLSVLIRVVPIRLIMIVSAVMGAIIVIGLAAVRYAVSRALVRSRTLCQGGRG
jgi:hypothetical protein